MFEKSKEELVALGADITTAEIAQQPELWRDTLEIYKANLDAIEAFLADARAMGEGRLSVVFTGAAPPTTWETPWHRTCVTPVTSPSTTSSPSPPRTSSPPRATS